MIYYKSGRGASKGGMLTAFFSSFQMNIGGSEWIIIALLALFLLFGTKKVPQVSRTVGKAIGEYQKAQELLHKEIENATTKPFDDSRMHFMGSNNGPVASEREKLESIARSLNIDCIGKTDDEIRSLISRSITG
ncbi:MAG TPA: twin-arginine translocase TatA/TatE family subunit [Candidatus Bathyarchaeia archaeon]|nr:twin-arginine translocase TatA/TatE family subunit [Candidatus Bathyarchaeia archaeon]